MHRSPHDSPQIQNFSVRSRKITQAVDEKKEDIQRQQKKGRKREDRVQPEKSFVINGVDYYQQEEVLQKQAEVLEDAFSVKGDYFYLKQGEIVTIRYIIGSYSEIKFQSKVGYFPTCLFRLIDGEYLSRSQASRSHLSI